MDELLYKRLAFCGRILLPSLSVLYATLGDIWGLPYTEQIPLTLTALAVFLNAILQVDSNKFFDAHDIVEKE